MSDRMMIRFEGYSCKLSPEQIVAAQPHIRETLEAAPGYNRYTANIAALARALPGVPFTVEGGDVPVTAWEAIIDRLAAIEARQALPQAINERCRVVVPDHRMLDMAFVRCETDCCTDRLQGYINEGWRILAICPQPDQRRPDYVLGRRTLQDGAE